MSVSSTCAWVQLAGPAVAGGSGTGSAAPTVHQSPSKTQSVQRYEEEVLGQWPILFIW